MINEINQPSKPSPDGGKDVSIPSPFGRGQGEGSVQNGNNMIKEINFLNPSPTEEETSLSPRPLGEGRVRALFKMEIKYDQGDQFSKPFSDGGRDVSIPSPFGRGQGEGSVQNGNNMINESNFLNPSPDGGGCLYPLALWERAG